MKKGKKEKKKRREREKDGEIKKEGMYDIAGQ